MTPNQERRQKHREQGKYAKVNPCYVCGKSAGEIYCSHPDTDHTIGDELLCLCEACCAKYEGMPGPEAVKAAFGDKGKTSNEADDAKALRFAGMMGHTVAVVTSGHGVCGVGNARRSASFLSCDLSQARAYAAEQAALEPSIYKRVGKAWKPVRAAIAKASGKVPA